MHEFVSGLMNVYTHDAMFQFGTKYLSKVKTAAKMAEDGKSVKFAALFILVELKNHFVEFLDAIKTLNAH